MSKNNNVHLKLLESHNRKINELIGYIEKKYSTKTSKATLIIVALSELLKLKKNDLEILLENYNII